MPTTSKQEAKIPFIDELAGYVNQERALEIMGIKSAAYLHELAYEGAIKAVYWDKRTLMYDRRSVETFRRERSPKRTKDG